MRRGVRAAIRTANVVAVALCVWWYVTDPGFEPIVTGVLVLAGLLIPLERPEVAQATSSQSSTAEVFRSETLQFKEIRSAIEEAPPFHQAEVARRYVGLPVRWNMFYWNAHPLPDGDLRVVLDFGAGTTQLVYSVVRHEDHREIALMKRGEPVTIQGLIAEVSTREATIEKATLHYSGKSSG